MRTVISHADADGTLSVTIFLSVFRKERHRIFFTSPSNLKVTLCNSILKANNLDEIYIFDLAGDKRTVFLSAVYDKSLWIDHHKWEEFEYPKKVEVFKRENAPSATQLVAEYFKVDSKLVEIANQIDTNSVKSDEARFLRNLIGALRWKSTSFSDLNKKLVSVAKKLSAKGLESFESEERIANLVKSYQDYLQKLGESIMDKIKFFEINGKKVAVLEVLKQIPVYLVTDRLENHEEGPFDIIAVLIHRTNLQANKIYTKVELRTQTNENVYKIANKLGGGGHERGSGATVPTFLNAEKLVEIIKNLEN